MNIERPLQLFALLILLSLNHFNNNHSMLVRALTPPTLPVPVPIELTTLSGSLIGVIEEDTWTVPY